MELLVTLGQILSHFPTLEYQWDLCCILQWGCGHKGLLKLTLAHLPPGCSVPILSGPCTTRTCFLVVWGPLQCHERQTTVASFQVTATKGERCGRNSNSSQRLATLSMLAVGEGEEGEGMETFGIGREQGWRGWILAAPNCTRILFCLLEFTPPFFCPGTYTSSMAGVGLRRPIGYKEAYAERGLCKVDLFIET